jgi:RNA polymerase sigma-70 factor, ECF subfamily
VRLELVNWVQRKGRGGVASYISNYHRTENWRLVPGFVDGRPAILVELRGSTRARVVNFVLLEWVGDRVVSIRDFTHVPYALAEADVIYAD